jgi:predicted NUDIX family NTP pyrophosphohydrolase
MLGGGCDGLVDHLLWGGRVEELAAQVLQQPQALGVMVRPGQPWLARSSTAQTSDRQVVSPGSRPMTFTLRRVSPKVRSTGVGVADPLVVLGREAQVGGELLAVGKQALDCRG